MQPQANPQPAVLPPINRSGEASTSALLAALAPHAGKALVFAYDGHDVQAGYHVTEVKAGRFASLDCGAVPEAWGETVIQLWDIPEEPGRARMTVEKFLAIMRKVAERVPFDGEAKLGFEVSDGTRAMQIFAPAAIELDGDKLRVELKPRPASCKPRDRWLEQEKAKAADGCGCAPTERASSDAAKACCG